jgi:hypothetical protein
MQFVCISCRNKGPLSACLLGFQQQNDRKQRSGWKVAGHFDVACACSFSSLSQLTTMRN